MKINFTGDATETRESRTKAERVMVAIDSSSFSGTVTMNVYDDNAEEYFPIYEFTEDGSWEIPLGMNKKYQFVLSGSSSPNINIFHNDIEMTYNQDTRWHG